VSNSEAYEKNIKEQFETLGRFVEAFENMVDEVRSSCMLLMGPNPFDDRLPLIAFHHGAMTAKPLFDIMRAMIAQLAKGDDIDDDERPVFKSVLNQIAREYNDLVNMRNNLLHGTWFIGYSSTEDPDAAEFYVRKQTSTKDGLGLLDLPKTAEELRALKVRCEAVRDQVGALQDCIPLLGDGSSIERRFKKEGENWVLKPYWKLSASERKRGRKPS
jgi:hypothetical protein